jgi:glucuronate isomerase
MNQMNDLETRLYEEISKISLIDSHSHIDPHSPTARDLDDLLGYHYYTELAHSAGMEQAPLRSEVPAEERVRAIAAYLPAIENTVQYSWMLEIARVLFGFQQSRIDATNCDELSSLASRALSREGWEDEVLFRSRVERLFLTNDFDDPLEGFDTHRYIPCLRADDLVFHLGQAAVVERLRRATGTDVGNASSLREALGGLFGRFRSRGARACAISLPPDFSPLPEDESAIDPALRRLLSGAELSAQESGAISRFVFWTLAGLASDFKLPFDLMIGVHRNVYRGGVHQGRDLFNRLTSLYQYRELFNTFPGVTFPVSVLDSAQNAELVAYSWIFPNVVAHGHWWYANTPSAIEADARQRLEAIPRPKLIGYYSDMYKLEFALPKFNMYRRSLARILAADFVGRRGWSEEQALELARDVLRGNAERVFGLSE